MQRSTDELTNYFKVIWKRKIFILVGTLVCMVAGGVVSLGKPKIYSAEAVIIVGKKMRISHTPLMLIEEIKDLVNRINIEYTRSEDAVQTGCSLYVRSIAKTTMIEISHEGTDKEMVKKLLEKIVNRLVVEHDRIAEISIQRYRNRIKEQEEMIKMIKSDIKAFLVDIDKTNEFIRNIWSRVEKALESEKVSDEMLSGPVDSMVMNTLKIGKRLELMDSYQDIVDVQNNILSNKLCVDLLNESKTRVVGGISDATIAPSNVKRNVKISGIGGLMITLFLALFTEHLRNENKKNENSV